MKSYLITFAAIAVPVLLAIGYVLLHNRLIKLQVKVEESSADIDVALEKRFDLLTEEIVAVKKYLGHEYQLLTDITTQRTGAKEEEKNRQLQQELTQEALKTIDEQISLQAKNMEQIKEQLARNSLCKSWLHLNSRNQAREQAAGEDALARGMAKHDDSVRQKINLLASAHRNLANVGANVEALSEQYPSLCSWISMDHFQRSIFDSEEHLQAARRFYNANVSLYNQTLAAIPWSVVASLCHMEKAPFYEVEEQKRSFTVNFD